MKYRPLGRTGWSVSEISFGASAIGGKVSDEESLAALNQAINCGVNALPRLPHPSASCAEGGNILSPKAATGTRQVVPAI